MRENSKSGALTEVSFLILLSLQKPNHGYAIMKSIAEATHGRVIIGAGSLYGALEHMKKKNWIEPCLYSSSKKKKYVITESGKEVLISETNRLQELLQLAQHQKEVNND